MGEPDVLGPVRATRTDMEVPEELETLILDLLAKDPDDRPRSAEMLGQRLREVQSRLDPWTPQRAARWWDAYQPKRPETSLPTPQEA